MESKGTLVRLPVNLADGQQTLEGWLIKVEEVEEDTLVVNVTTSADTMIGKYELLYETKLKNSEKDFVKQDLDTFICVLFNPWCKGMDNYS